MGHCSALLHENRSHLYLYPSGLHQWTTQFVFNKERMLHLWCHVWLTFKPSSMADFYESSVDYTYSHFVGLHWCIRLSEPLYVLHQKGHAHLCSVRYFTLWHRRVESIRLMSGPWLSFHSDLLNCRSAELWPVWHWAFSGFIPSPDLCKRF